MKDSSKKPNFIQTVWRTGYKFTEERDMKLKKWLTVSQLIVMITPVISGVLLFIVINNYNKNTQV